MKEKSRYKGIGICGTIALILIVLKIFGVVDLEWLVVFSPIIICFTLKLASLFLTLLAFVYNWRKRK